MSKKSVQSHNVGIVGQKHARFRSIDTCSMTVQKVEYVDEIGESFPKALDLKALSRITNEMVDQLTLDSQPLLSGSVTVDVTDEDLIVAGGGRIEGGDVFDGDNNKITGDVTKIEELTNKGVDNIRLGIINAAQASMNLTPAG